MHVCPEVRGQLPGVSISCAHADLAASALTHWVIRLVIFFLDVSVVCVF